MKKQKPNELSILPFPSAEAFESWMAENHANPEGIWLRLFKKDSGKETITYDEALDVALCYGWIDGQLKKFDDESWLRKFTPRRNGSKWSKRNTEHVDRLTKGGRMKPSGLAEVEKAKADGRWEQAYKAQSNMTIPDDFMKALSANPPALAFFQTLNKANLYAIAYRLTTAKKPETREKRMQQILEMMARGEKFH